MKFWQAFRNFVAKKRKTFPNSKMLKLQFFEQIYFFHQKWFFSNGECNLDNGSKYFSLRVHAFAAQIPKTTKKNFELFERKITFLEMFLCTCIKVIVATLPKFSRQNSGKIFYWISGNEEKLISLPKNFFLKIFAWTCTTNFWQAWVTMPAKVPKIFFSQSPKRIAMQFCSKKVVISFSSFLQKNKKKLHLDTQNPVVTTLSKKFLV